MRKVLYAIAAAAVVAGGYTASPYVYASYVSSNQFDEAKANREIIQLTSFNPKWDVDRRLKGNLLSPEELAVQWQGLDKDGTPLEEKAFHESEERTSSTSARR